MEEMAFKSLCHSVGLVRQEKNGILSKSLRMSGRQVWTCSRKPERRQKTFATIQINKSEKKWLAFHIQTACSVTNFQRQASFLSALKVKKLRDATKSSNVFKKLKYENKTLWNKICKQ